MIPLKYYGYLGVALLISYSYYFTYNFGYDNSKTTLELEYSKAFESKLEQSLAKADLELQEALSIQKKGLEKVAELNQKYDELNKDKLTIQEALNEALSQETTAPNTCTTLSDGYYQLYRKLYKTKPTR